MQAPMLLARLAIYPEVQGSKLAVDIFSFVTNFFYPTCGSVEGAIV